MLDFEATCWKDKQKKSQEISEDIFRWQGHTSVSLVHSVSVEFPAVLLNTANGAIEAEFHHYVQPKENPTLSDFCRELTGITQVYVLHMYIYSGMCHVLYCNITGTVESS